MTDKDGNRMIVCRRGEPRPRCFMLSLIKKAMRVLP